MIKKTLALPRVQITLVVAIAFLLRLILATSPELDIDEAIFYAPAALSYSHGDLFANTFALAHPVLIKLLFAGSVLLFGEHGRFFTLFPWLPESIGAIRLVSSILGAATCLVIYQLVKELTGSHSLSALASILLAFDPISIGESSYGLLDPGTVLFYMVSVLFFYRFVKNGKALDFYTSAVCFGLAVASKYYAVIAFPILIGILLCKGKFRVKWKSMAVFLTVSIIVFFAVQPYLWSNPLVNLWPSLARTRANLTGHLVKPPGTPFLIPRGKLFGGPWLHVGSNQFASKPDFYADPSYAAPSPWWYVSYIQVMYSTPFELVTYPLAFCWIIVQFLRRRVTDLTVVSALLVSVPMMFFSIIPLRLPQYAILPSTSAVLLGPASILGLDRRWRWVFFVSLLAVHVGWTLYALLTADGNLTGWDFYITFLTPLMANLFGILWKLTRGIHL